MMLIASAIFCFLVFSSLWVRWKDQRITLVQVVWSVPLSLVCLALSIVCIVADLGVSDNMAVMAAAGAIGILSIVVDKIYYNDIVAGFVDRRYAVVPSGSHSGLGPKSAVALIALAAATRVSLVLAALILLRMSHALYAVKHGQL